MFSFLLLARLFLLLSALCCPVFAASNSHSHSPPPPPCSNCTSCSSIHNVSFPFGTSDSCGLPEFRLDCSQSPPLWSPPGQLPRYQVLNITSDDVSSGTGTFVVQNSSNVSICAALNDTRPPSSISCPDSSFGIGFRLAGNVNLVFKCNASAVQNLSVSSVVNRFIFSSTQCSNFYNVCNHENRSRVPCFEALDEQANVSSVKKTYQCQRNTSFLYPPTSLTSPLAVQLRWSVSQSYYDCDYCKRSNGTCQQNENGSFRCACPGGRRFVAPCNPEDNFDANCRLHLCEKSVQFVIGALAIALAIIIVGASFGIYCCWKTKAVNQLTRLPQDSSSTNFKLFLADQCGPVPQKTFSYDELLHATDSFSVNKTLGDGGFGTVYEGTLYNGQKVAVKRMYAENVRRLEQFLNEIKILSGLVDHPNLVKLYGFCCEKHEDLLLVYEFVSNGTLAHHLHGHAGKGLLWETRLNIALETAEALAYLHSYLPPILHRDVKSTNILLDENFHVKVADFGLSRFLPVTATHISTTPQGTPGYVDPEYHHCYQVNEKSDVYSFGVVLVELVSGKTPVDLSRDHMEINLSSLAVVKIQTGALDELIDPYLEVWRYCSVKEMVKRVAELAFQCLALSKDDRPSMKSVVETLRNIKNFGYSDGTRKKTLQVSFSRDSVDADETCKLMETCGTPTSPMSLKENWPSSVSNLVASSEASVEKYPIHSRSSNSP